MYQSSKVVAKDDVLLILTRDLGDGKVGCKIIVNVRAISLIEPTKTGSMITFNTDTPNQDVLEDVQTIAKMSNSVLIRGDLSQVEEPVGEIEE